MIVWRDKCKYSNVKCANCGKTISSANLHNIEIGKTYDKKMSFYLCYSCLKELEESISCIQPEGISAWEICENQSRKPEDAKNCLHCKECIISTANGYEKCFECLLEGFVFYEDEVPDIKRCHKD